MTGTSAPATDAAPTFHALLIGVDAYTVKPLHGCVNDIDAIQRILVDQAGIAPDRITRLTSPHDGVVQDATVPSAPATLANIRAAFDALGSDRVAPGDQVFIYYAGHGGRQQVTADMPTMHRESLLPVDFNAGPSGWDVFYDFQFNAALSRIVARTRSVSVILDCCHSSGATRDVSANGSGMTGRFMDPAVDLGRTAPIPIPADLLADAAASERGVATSGDGVDVCQLIAACRSHEIANESTAKDGTRHGLLTRALMDALAGLGRDELRVLPWGRVWQKLRADIETANPNQHPWMAGSLGRAVLGGPPVDGDVGFGVVRTGTNLYTIDAGTLVGLTPGTKLAIYADTPLMFPPLGSDADLASRFSNVSLVVTEATLSTATAEAAGEPFDLPVGVRARIIAAGDADRLRVAMVPEDPAVVASIRESSLLQLVPAAEAEVRLEQRADGTWALGDDVHGARDGYPVLLSIPAAKISNARWVLEHYLRYAGPLRMARRSLDLPGALKVRFLACPAQGTITPQQAQEGKFPELPMSAEFPYELAPDDCFCIRVHNSSGERLQIAILNAAGSGKVQYLGDQVVDANATCTVWMDNELGQPFVAGLPSGAASCIDRVVVIGTSAPALDLKHLIEQSSFAQVLARGGFGTRDFGGGEAEPDRWTATEVLVRTRKATA
jgi:hypothetical protein